MADPISTATKGATEGGKAASGVAGKQLGPLPVGAWAVVIGGALFFSFYMSKKKSTATNADNTTTPSALVYTGVGGNTGNTSASTVPQTAGYQTNEAWAAAAKTFLISQSVDAGDASTAVDLYINAQQLTAKQNAWISIATKSIGPPPQSLPPVIANPNPSGPTQNNAPTYDSVWGTSIPFVGGALMGTQYVVQGSDRLPDIAKKTYGLGNDDYSSLEFAMNEIVNANHDKIGDLANIPQGTKLYLPVLASEQFPAFGNKLPIMGYNPANFTDPNKTSGDAYVDAGWIPKNALVPRQGH